MSVGIGPALRTGWLNALGGVAYSEPAMYVQLHVGDPGAAGTSSVSTTTTRAAITFAAESGGSIAADIQPEWLNWAGATETISHVSLWDAPTGGNFLWSVDTVDGDIGPGEDLILDSLTLSVGPAAA